MKTKNDTVTPPERGRWGGFLRQNLFLIFLILTAFLLFLAAPRPLRELPGYVDWNTIYTLAGLLLITNAVRESGFFHVTARRLACHIRNERYLALFLVFLAALLSAFFTNDISLFILVPLTLGLQELLQRNYTRIIIFEALAVNAGSALTPIGNPQNIFLWHQWGISFPLFVREMAPVVGVMMLWLLLFTFFVFPPEKIRLEERRPASTDKTLFWISLLLLAGFIVSIETDVGPWFLLVLFPVYALIAPRSLLCADWGLLLLFIFMFVDIALLCHLPAVHGLITTLHPEESRHLFLAGTLGSQLISNVPATLLFSHYTTEYRTLAWAVNTGGNGLLIASFANIIALRFVRDRKKYLLFHLYSIPFFLVTVLTVWILLIK